MTLAPGTRLGGVPRLAKLAERGEADRAFEWLRRAHAQRDPGLVEIKAIPHFRSLHGDPRRVAFEKKMGLED